MKAHRLVLVSLLTTGVVASVAGGLGAAPAASAAAPCGINNATVVKRTSHAMLVRRGKPRKHFWACLHGGRAVHVLSETDGVSVGRYAFGGRYLAISNSDCLAECADDAVRVYNLRSRHLVRTFSVYHVAKMLVGTRGGVAVVSDSEFDEFRGIRVWDSRGTTVVTRFPPTVRLGSVRVAGNLLRWTQAGVQRSFRMRSWRRSPD